MLYFNITVTNLDLSIFDIGYLNDLKRIMKVASKKYEAFLSTVPGLIRNLYQALLILEEHQRRLSSNFCPSPERFDLLDVSNTKESEQLTECYIKEFSHLFHSIIHLISFGEKLKALLVFGYHVQPCDDNQLNALEENVQALRKLQTTTLQYSLIVKKQPPLVLTTGDFIDTEARLLANISPVGQTLQVRIIKAVDAENLISGASRCEDITSPAVIVGNRAALLEYGEIGISQFEEKPLLKTITESWQVDEEHSINTTDQKCVLLYEVVPNLEKNENLATSGRIWTLSRPFVLINDSAQYSNAYAAIFLEGVFNYEKEIEWSKLATVLIWVFSYLTGATKRSLSESDLEYFRWKLGVHTDSDTISFKRFFKEYVQPDSKFSLWSWFYCVCETIKKQELLQYWEEGYLMGFGTKERFAIKMRGKKSCFLLRFSESQLGVLSISRFDFDSARVHRHTAFLLPPDQELHALAKLLRNFDQLEDINYFCDKDFNVINKKLFLENPDLKEQQDSSVRIETETAKACSIHTILFGFESHPTWSSLFSSLKQAVQVTLNA